MSTIHLPTPLTGLSQIAGAYDGLICDVWGVIHNGREGFPDAIAAITQFRQTRGPVVLLSNAPRPAEGVETQFDRIGVPRGFYDAVVTSGGAARADLERRVVEAGKTLHVFHLGPNRDSPLLAGLDVVSSPLAEADVVLCTGPFQDETEKPEDYREMLTEVKARGLTFLCANPDIVVQRGAQIIYCAGALARYFEEMGGRVVYYGKPHPAVFRDALAALGARKKTANVLVIGDGLETDIKGANGVGLDSLFVASGIHGREFHENRDALAARFAAHGVRATAAMDALRW